MRLSGIVRQRFRGFRVIDLAALVVCLALALTVYAYKTSAAAQGADITDVESQIHDETKTVQPAARPGRPSRGARPAGAAVAHLRRPGAGRRQAGGDAAGAAPGRRPGGQP